MESLKSINPPSLARPSGFSYAVRSAGGPTIHLAGHTAMDADGVIVGAGDLGAQFKQALANLSETLRAAEVAPQNVARLRIYVTDIDAYKRSREVIGMAYREMFGRHYPAMTLVQVSRLWDAEAMIEIEATAVAPPKA